VAVKFRNDLLPDLGIALKLYFRCRPRVIQLARGTCFKQLERLVERPGLIITLGTQLVEVIGGLSQHRAEVCLRSRPGDAIVKALAVLVDPCRQHALLVYIEHR